MMENRLDKFTDEEIQVMYIGAQGRFRGYSKLKLSDADQLVVDFNKEIEAELKKRRDILEAEIERTTPRCECCNQRIEK